MIESIILYKVVAMIFCFVTGIYFLNTGHQGLKNEAKVFVDRRQDQCWIDFIDRRKN